MFTASRMTGSMKWFPERTTFIVLVVKSLSFSFLVVIWAWPKAVIVNVNAANAVKSLLIVRYL